MAVWVVRTGGPEISGKGETGCSAGSDVSHLACRLAGRCRAAPPRRYGRYVRSHAEAGTALPATGATKARLGRWRAPISSPQGAVDVGSDCRRCPQPVDTETAWACAQHVRMAWGSLTRLERAHML